MSESKLSRSQLIFATFSISLGTFLISLDQFIANVSIPSIAGELGASQNNGAWVITSFTVASAIMIPMTGRLTEIFGRVRLFCVSAIAFSMASFLCGLATSLPMLIFFRVLQGAVSGALIPLSQTLLLLIYPEKKKGLAIGFWGLVVMIGPAMGPVLGGWITYNYGWPWIFYINVPTGVLAGVLTYVIMSPHESERKKVHINKLAFFLFALGIGCMQIILDKGQDLDWWHSPIIVGMTVVTCVSLAYFLVINQCSEAPLIDFSFFKSRNFALGSIIISITMMLLFGSFIVFPLWVQTQLGYTQYLAGLTLFPVGIFSAILFPFLGYYLDKFRLIYLIIAAFAIFAITFFWFSRLYSGVSFRDIVLPRYVQGIGFALFYLPLTAIALAGIPPEKMPAATSLFSFIRMLFISAGTSLSITFWYRRESFYQSRYVEYITSENQQLAPYLKEVNELGITGHSSDAFLMNIIENEAFTQSLLDLCYLASIISILLIGLLFFFRSRKQVLQGKKELSKRG